jgi:hypothetical protein
VDELLWVVVCFDAVLVLLGVFAIVLGIVLTRPVTENERAPEKNVWFSSATTSGSRKRLYQQKDIRVTHTQTGSLVRKCGQNVGTAVLQRRPSRI